MSFARPSFFPVLLISLSLWLSSLGFAQGKVRIVVSVDWEGRDLQKQNLEAMNRFREDYPDIALQHFLNAAYYTKPNANAEQVTTAIRSVLRPQDEHGLHLHAWRSLMQAAGVNFRRGPSFVGADVELSSCKFDCGHDVAITAYTQTELQQVFRYSNKILQEQGFDRPTSFRAGGWQADRKVLRALAAEGFRLDSSATYAPYLYPSWGHANLHPFVAGLWPDTVPTSQPYTIELAPDMSIVELPNNGCLADYMSASAILEAFRVNAELLEKEPAADVYLSIGFHQETARSYLPQLRQGIDEIRAYAKSRNIPIEFGLTDF